MPKRKISKLLTLPIAVAGGWIGYSAVAIDRRQPLPDAILADKLTFLSKAGGWLNAYVDRSGAGRPLVLIHSVNAAASAFEMGPLFRHYRGRRPVYALDLPGYGQSNRLQRDYTPQLFANAIAEFLETQVGEPADVVGLSLGCEFVARAALARPELFHSLAFISPSGLGSASLRPRLTADRGARHRRWPAPRAGLPAVGPRPVRPDRHAAQHRVLPAQELRGTDHARLRRLWLCDSAPAGRGARAAVLHRRNAVHARRCDDAVREAGRAHAGAV